MPQQPAPPSPQHNASFRLKLADNFKLDPLIQPVSLPDSQTSRAAANIDFSYEKSVLEKPPTSDNVKPFLTGATSNTLLDPAAQACLLEGHPLDVVSLAVAAQPPGKIEEANVLKFCQNLHRIKNMGFDLSTAVGALVKAGNVLNVATDFCLQASSS